jgi:hypothetical protein
MATWIVHLRLAENLFEDIPDLDKEAFAIGNVAPDSGVPDEDWEKFTPPPEVSHFQDSDREPWSIADLDFFREYLSTEARKEDDAKRFSFLLGYFFHLVTDNLWADRIARPTMEKFKDEFEADPKFVWQVKRDWYGLDLEHVRQNPESIYWHTFLPAEFDQDYLDFMPVEAIQQRIQHIKDLYQRTDDDIEEWYGNRPDLYLSKGEMETFIKVGTKILHEIYEILIVKNLNTNARLSVLELYPLEE